LNGCGNPFITLSKALTDSVHSVFFCSIALVFSTTTLASSNILKTRTTLKRVKMDEGVFELWQDMAFQAKASSNKIAIL